MALLHVLELGDHVLLRLTRFLLAEEVCRQLVPIALKLQNIVLLILSFALKPAELTLNSSQVALRAVTLCHCLVSFKGQLLFVSFELAHATFQHSVRSFHFL